MSLQQQVNHLKEMIVNAETKIRLEKLAIEMLEKKIEELQNQLNQEKKI